MAETGVTDRILRTLTAPARASGLDTGSFQNFSTRPWFVHSSLHVRYTHAHTELSVNSDQAVGVFSNTARSARAGLISRNHSAST